MSPVQPPRISSPQTPPPHASMVQTSPPAPATTSSSGVLVSLGVELPPPLPATRSGQRLQLGFPPMLQAPASLHLPHRHSNTSPRHSPPPRQPPQQTSIVRAVPSPP